MRNGDDFGVGAECLEAPFDVPQQSLCDLLSRQAEIVRERDEASREVRRPGLEADVYFVVSQPV
ncbi:hypothetical protein BO226_20795 [Rhodococcus sp. 2G]|nr:hypothetical protein BO226_20795 [Rhodococcus sp. 2G]